MKTKYKYIQFRPTALTDVWNCVNNKDQIYLGVIAYYKPWKQFVFSAKDPTYIFSIDFLDDIIDFMKQLSKDA